MRITSLILAAVALCLTSAPVLADPPVWINADYVEEAFAQFSKNNPSEDDINFVPGSPIESGISSFQVISLDGSFKMHALQITTPILPPTSNSKIFVSMAKNFLDKARSDEKELAKVLEMSEEEQQRPGNLAILERDIEIMVNASMANTLTHVLKQIGELSSND